MAQERLAGFKVLDIQDKINFESIIKKLGQAYIEKNMFYLFIV